MKKVQILRLCMFPTELRRELKWQLALYVGLIREAIFINIWIAAMHRIPTDMSLRTTVQD